MWRLGILLGGFASLALQPALPLFAATSTKAKPAKKPTAKTPRKLVKKTPPKPQSPLNSMSQDYSFNYKGNIVCPDGCQAVSVRAILITPSGTTIEKSVNVAEDGEFKLDISFKESPFGDLDWTLQVEKDGIAVKEAHGRSVLLEGGLQFEQEFTL